MLNISTYGRMVAHNITNKQLIKYDWSKLIGKNVYRNKNYLGRLTNKINLNSTTAIVEKKNKISGNIEQKEVKLTEICTWD